MVASPQCPLLFHLAKAILVYELREQQPTLASSCAIATEPPITIASAQAELNLRKIAFGQGKKRGSLHHLACRDRAAFRRQQEVRFSRQRIPQTRPFSPPTQTVPLENLEISNWTGIILLS